MNPVVPRTLSLALLASLLFCFNGFGTKPWSS